MSLTTPVCDFGKAPVEFTLRSVQGETRSLDDIKRSNGFLIAFICNHCPYVRSILPDFVETAQLLQEVYHIGVAAISSNDVSAYPEDSFEKMCIISAQYHFPFPYLYDQDQSVAKAYGAVCTPDFFGFNANNELQYRGRYNESKKDRLEGVACDLLEAMALVAKTGQGPEKQYPSIGCSIKWKS